VFLFILEVCMTFVSELTGKSVTDINGNQIGILKDLVAHKHKDSHHPFIDAIIVQFKNEQYEIPFAEVVVLLAAAISLSQRKGEYQPYIAKEEDILLVQDVMDKQIIDIDGARVVRVNDIELVRVNGNIVVSNVDVGTTGIMRRIGLSRLSRLTSTLLKRDPNHGYISWEFVEPLRHDQSMRLKVPAAKLAELHPSDLADIISELSHTDTDQLLDNLDIKHLADTLEEVEPDFQASLVKGMSDEKVADLLEEMSPDEAADLLAELPAQRSENLLDLMEVDDAKDVRKLLLFHEESAGGLMTTDYVSVQPELTAEETIRYLRKVGDEAELIYYVYVTDPTNHLIGVFSLSDLIMAQPEIKVIEFMYKRVVSVNLKDQQDEIAQVVSKYNLMAVPVVDDQNVLHGIVTADDALDQIIPTAWKKRLPRFFGAVK
jgi:magnesium transporter